MSVSNYNPLAVRAHKYSTNDHGYDNINHS